MYYKIENGILKPVTGLVSVGEIQKNAKFLTDAEAESIWAYKLANNQPERRHGFTARADGYIVEDGKWTTVWAYDPIVYTKEDFNRALEDHLLSERIARGYDTREPTIYASSSVPRWRQDAVDWAAHVDSVMLYGLGVINTWKESGEAPDYDEFVAGLPKIEWTEA